MNRYKFLEDKHIHTLDSKPLFGTSTVTGIVSKGNALSWWSSGRAVSVMGWTPAKDKNGKAVPKKQRKEIAKIAYDMIYLGGIDYYLELLDKAYRAHKDELSKSADKGIDLHFWLEQFVRYEMGQDNEFDRQDIASAERTHPFVEWSKKNVKRFLWSEGFCYSESLWVGGISDFGAELNDGRCIVGDFKSSKEAYYSQFLQGAAYAIQMEENGILDKDGNKIGDCPKIDDLVIFPFGAEKVEPVFSKLPIGELKEAFRSAVILHKSKTKWEAI